MDLWFNLYVFVFLLYTFWCILFLFIFNICVSCHFPALWFSSLVVSPPGNISGFSARVARTFFFSLNLPEWDTFTWRPLLAVVLSTILSSRASSWESCTVSSGWAADPVAVPEPCRPVVALETNSAGISYRTLGWDFFLLKKVSFHQPGDGSAMMEDWWDGWSTEEIVWEKLEDC